MPEAMFIYHTCHMKKDQENCRSPLVFPMQSGAGIHTTVVGQLRGNLNVLCGDEENLQHAHHQEYG
jgi:hypothetical protein